MLSLGQTVFIKQMRLTLYSDQVELAVDRPPGHRVDGSADDL